MPPRLPTPELHFCGLDASCYAYMLYNWQTLIGGLVALFAALYAGRFVQRQIAASERIEAERLRRRGLAARAVLPLTLARFVAYAEACGGLIARLAGPEVPPAAVSGRPLAAPALPQEAVADLERTIEAAHDDRVVETLTRLAGHTQMLHSILMDAVAHTAAGGSRDQRVAANLPAWTLRVALVHAAASSMFGWARGEVDRPDEVDWARVEKSLAILALDGAATSSLVADARAQGLTPLTM